jgi:hypothetical protein
MFSSPSDFGLSTFPGILTLCQFPDDLASSELRETKTAGGTLNAKGFFLQGANIKQTPV